MSRVFQAAVCLALTLAALEYCSAAERLVPAFPGAEGFGAYAKGGRGGKVLFVDNLQDYGEKENPIPGTLRAACEAKGPRTVIFRTSGTITLKRALMITNGFITIAGQSAPGDGICIRGNIFGVGQYDAPTTDVILRHLRVRVGPGKRKGDDLDGLKINNASNVIVDHCSVSWGVDETLPITAHPTGYSRAGRIKKKDYKGPIGVTENLTIQWCIVSEGLSHSTNKKGEHSKGLMVAYGPTRVTLHHNLLAHNNDRNPYLPAECEAPFIIDTRNNLVYNWGVAAGVSYGKINENGYLNFVGNRYLPGPDSRKVPCLQFGVPTRVYLKDNLGAVRTSDKDPESKAMLAAGKKLDHSGNNRKFDAKRMLVDKPFDTPKVTTHLAKELEEVILPVVGATRPKRDAVDKRIVKEVKERKGGIIDDPKERGGWPELKSTPPPADKDEDGMPDAWETEHKLNPAKADNNADPDGDGYTNLEEYLNVTNPRRGENSGQQSPARDVLKAAPKE